MVRRHVATPEVPIVDVAWEGVLLLALKENVDLLTGTRGEADLASMAIVRGDLTVEQVGQQDMIAINTSHNLTPISFAESAPLDSFLDLRNDVQVLANDLFRTRQALDLLIRNIKGL
jgi:hypothetical protein